MDKRLIITILILLLAIPVYAAPPTRQTTYTSGQTIQPADVTANEDVIYSYLGSGVDTYKANTITGSALASNIAITSSGNMTFSGTTNLSGTFKLSGTSITSSAAEINITDGLTSSTAELNLLDGVTATTVELNYIDGVTSALQTQLDGKSATTGNASIATVGTITTGTWNATAVAVAKGGTGATTASSARSNLGLGTLSTKDTVALATDVTGNLAVTNLNSGTSASSSTFWRGDGAWVVAIENILDYSTSASSSTARNSKDFNVCYGSVSVNASSSQAITNLPFTSSSTYAVTCTFSTTSPTFQNTIGAVKDSGTQFTIYNGHSSTLTINWIAVGI